MGTRNRFLFVVFLLGGIMFLMYQQNGEKLWYNTTYYRQQYGATTALKGRSPSSDVMSSKKVVDISPSGDPDRDLLILYNRIPKTGSTSFMNVVYNLHAMNRFSAAYVNVSSRSHRWLFADQYQFAKNITRWKERKPAIYHGHFPFLNFIKLGIKQPVYINIVRDPLERLASHYYFLRYGDTYLPNKIRNKQGDETTFDECVQQRKPECHPNKLWLQIPYFCGSDPFCWKPGNRAALHRAQRNVLNHYFLVGTTNQLGPFIEILERTLPTIFRGASALFGNGVHIRKTKTKKPLSTETIDYFKSSKVWKLEHDFYEFVEKLFNDIHGNVKTGTSWSYVKVKP